MIVRTGGEVVAVAAELPWAGRLLATQLGLDATEEPKTDPTVTLRLETSRAAFDRAGWSIVTRGAYSRGTGVVLEDVGGSGFDLRVDAGGDVLDVTARYRPDAKTRAANLALADRFGLLATQVLVHYPVLWRAGWRGRVPLHASVLATEFGTPLLAGPGGVGKTTILSAALREGATATADNLCCADATSCFGLAEPLRTDAEGGRGPRTSHGRVSRPFGARDAVLEPDRIVVVGRAERTSVAPIPPEPAARALVAGTYAAGELRRYWAFAATLALATGRGPAHPPIGEVAAAYTAGRPCLEVRVGNGDRISVAQLCGAGITGAAEKEVRP
jgi:hypothetical protein